LGGVATAMAPLTFIERALAAASSSATPTGQPLGRWSPLQFGDVAAGGDLAKRTEQNWNRLQHPAYRVPAIFENPEIDRWPGDWVGRTLLADILLARSTSRDASAVAPAFASMPAHLNQAGYFGHVIDPQAINEQQTGDSHAWVIRSLYEYYQWTHDARAREMFDALVRNLAIPMGDWWESYPITADAREKGQGGVNGEGRWRHGRWLLSSDVGNQFMALDGLTQAWQLDRSAELKGAIDRGIDRFLEMNLLSLQVQTHATLTTCRALLRMYELTNEPRLLRAVEERYQLYREIGMTETYGNYNWFERPDTWTEPCAIIDSFIVAVQLWRITGEPRYLEDAHLIWFNGVARGQRATGGFGCDTCAGTENPFLDMKLIYEATFCCTMRGGEAHSQAIQSLYHVRPGELAITFYNSSKASVDLGSAQIKLEQSTQYPYAGEVRLKVTASNAAAPVTLRLFTPSWMANPKLMLNGRRLDAKLEHGFLVAALTPRQGDQLTLASTLKNWVRPTLNPHSARGYHAFLAGPLMLGSSGKEEIFLDPSVELDARAPGRFQVKGQATILARINDLNDLPLPGWDPLDANPAEPDKNTQRLEKILTEQPAYRRQVLFKGA
jgi:hypothetical protein